MSYLPLRIFDLLYGASGSAKSTYIVKLIKQLHKETGKKARIWISDGSLASYEGLVLKGIAEVGEFGHRPWPQDTLMNRLAMGWGLSDPNNPLSDLVKTEQKDLENYCITVLEGVSTSAKYIMGHVKGGLAWRAAQGEKIGPDSAIKIFEGEFNAKGEFIKGSGPGTSFGGSGQAHYGQTQSVVIDTVNQFKCLPMHVVMTAHEYVNDPEKDDLINEKLIGPEISGKKLTGSFQKLFNNTMHAMALGEKINKQTTDGRVSEWDNEYRLYTRDHYATEGNFKLRYKALTRGVDNKFPIYFVSENPGDAILEYYQQLHEYKMRED